MWILNKKYIDVPKIFLISYNSGVIKLSSILSNIVIPDIGLVSYVIGIYGGILLKIISLLRVVKRSISFKISIILMIVWKNIKVF